MLNTHFLLFFGDFDKSFSLDNAHASMALRSLNHDFIVHEALVLVLHMFNAVIIGDAHHANRQVATRRIVVEQEVPRP